MALTQSRMSNTLLFLTPAIQSAFKLLDISPYNISTIKEIRNAYIKKAFILHPDRNPGKDTTLAMQNLHCAYQLLQEHINNEPIELTQDPIKAIVHNWNLQQCEIFRKQEGKLRMMNEIREILLADLAREAAIGKDITIDLEEISGWASLRYQKICKDTQKELEQGEENFKMNLDLKMFQLDILSLKEDIMKSGFYKILECLIGFPLLLSMWKEGVGKALKEFIIGGLVISVSLGPGA
ncbi:hypothetical protein EAF00_007855 [Botryotinia globosa]|nr:hypothetical protein EAF00_007855 [Botryotinia globosa]